LIRFLTGEGRDANHGKPFLPNNRTQTAHFTARGGINEKWVKCSLGQVKLTVFTVTVAKMTRCPEVFLLIKIPTLLPLCPKGIPTEQLVLLRPIIRANSVCFYKAVPEQRANNCSGKN
jgi:hypothetical protein